VFDHVTLPADHCASDTLTSSFTRYKFVTYLLTYLCTYHIRSTNTDAFIQHTSTLLFVGFPGQPTTLTCMRGELFN